MSYRDWYVGMKVVCVEAVPRNDLWHRTDDDLPLAGKVYTIREIGCWHPNYPSDVAVRLAEIVNTPNHWIEQPTELVETFFYAERFRPVVPRKTDISIFTAMLSPERGKVEA